MQRFAGEIPTQNTAARLGRIRWGVRKGGGRICTKYRNTKKQQKNKHKYNTTQIPFLSQGLILFFLYIGFSYFSRAFLAQFSQNKHHTKKEAKIIGQFNIVMLDFSIFISF